MFYYQHELEQVARCSCQILVRNTCVCGDPETCDEFAVYNWQVTYQIFNGIHSDIMTFNKEDNQNNRKKLNIHISRVSTNSYVHYLSIF